VATDIDKKGVSSLPPQRLTRSFTARVVDNSQVNKDHLLLTFQPLAGTPEPRPGQFYMISTGTPNEPLLKRPFCFFRKTREGIQLLYRVRGKGTSLLKEVVPGDTLEAIGPLGNSYPMPSRKHTPVVVAGGIAIASVFPHVQRLRDRATVIFGARTEDDLLMLDELRGRARELHIRTEDGSAGKRGTVMDALRELSPDGGHVLYVCGPRGMIKAVTDFAREKGLKGHASLEEFMACGIGACMGCVVNTVKGYKRVCKEGPLFKLDEILL
jgi:dihydroorotate dehydrogenase electron transfer subunit